MKMRAGGRKDKFIASSFTSLNQQIVTEGLLCAKAGQGGADTAPSSSRIKCSLEGTLQKHFN